MIKIISFLILAQFMSAQILENANTSPIHILGTIHKNEDPTKLDTTFNPSWVKNLRLLLPCNNVNIPKKASRLPNAPRDYRNGIHKGIDFFAAWGTEVRAVAKGLVVRADHNYKEYPPDFRVKMLKSSGKVGHTPSDIFNSVLLGKAVFLDHGFDLVPGFRVITIYAHLSSIRNDITGGAIVEPGQIIGRTGNTGTRPSTLGTKKEAHLHWEMILQKDNQEIYLGKDISHEKLYDILISIFEQR
tara:strand:- start:5810 stop:6541 length:732 start_codon:yes stop_codon:yes gene_type:complete